MGGSRPEQAPAPRRDTGAALPFAGSAVAQRWRRTRGSTRRLAILGALVVVLGIMLVPTLRAWLQQRDDYAALQAQVVHQEQLVAQLTAQDKAWANPAYVEEQARRRLQMVKPGETAYQVIGADGVATGEPGVGHGAVVTAGDAKLPWYGKVWTSVTTTDELGHTSVDATTAPIDPSKSEPGAATSGGGTSSRGASIGGTSSGAANNTSGSSVSGSGSSGAQGTDTRR